MFVAPTCASPLCKSCREWPSASMRVKEKTKRSLALFFVRKRCLRACQRRGLGGGGGRFPTGFNRCWGMGFV